MPDVANYETEDAWMAACVPARKEEGDDQDQAVATCLNIWRNKGAKAITKKEGDGEHPAGHYLVVEDPKSPSTWHLRVRNAAGDLDHRLMGAAWAALHGGYRGNRYEGPSKDAAIAKLRKLYASEGLDTPGKSLDADALVYHGGAVKALGDGRVGGYLVRYASEDELDLDGEYFDGKTWYGDATESPVYYHHGLDTKLGRRVLGKGALDPQEVGVWIEAQLEMRDEYEKAVYRLAEGGKLGWSSGTAPHLVEREGRHILRWPLGLDASLTPTPADPGNRALPLKTWAKSATMEGLLETALDESAVGGVTIKAESVTVTVVNQTPVEEATTEAKTMSEKENETTPQAEPVDVEAIAKATAEAAVKAYRAELEKEEPVDKSGFVVTGDQADRALEGNPFKSFGGFLQAIADAETPGRIDERLLPLRSGDADMKGYFDMSRALPNVVGNAYQSSMKAMKQTGLNEGVGAAGGFLVGTDVGGSIMDRVYGVGELLRRVDTATISANSNGITFWAVNETARTAGNRRGGILGYWAAEAAEKTASHPTFRELELRLHKLVALVYSTDELLADASALESWILRNLPEELRFMAEDAIIRGTGVGQPLGILASGCLVTQAAEVGQAANTVVAENIINMWSRRWAGARDYVWIINQDVEPQLHLMGIGVGTGGQLVYMPPGGLSAAPYGTLLGRPVLVSEYADTVGDVGDVILASLGEYQAITKGGIESASSIHVRFIYDETCFRFVMRYDGQPKWAQPLTPYQSALTQSPFVVLAAR